MLQSVVDTSKACGLLMASSAPLMDRHFFTWRDNRHYRGQAVQER
jgi:hypothetical protein